MNFISSDGKKSYWRKYDSPLQTELDLSSVFEPNITAVAYAYCKVFSPDKRTVTGLLGSNDGATLYCNGERVFQFHGKRSLIHDENAMSLNLQEGVNHILIKIEQWKAGWGFTFRLKDLEVRNHNHNYYINF